MTQPKLTHAERGRLGGLANAHKNPEGNRQRGAKGGKATLETYGKAHFVRMTYIRQGKLSPNRKGDSNG